MPQHLEMVFKADGREWCQSNVNLGIKGGAVLLFNAPGEIKLVAFDPGLSCTIQKRLGRIGIFKDFVLNNNAAVFDLVKDPRKAHQRLVTDMRKPVNTAKPDHIAKRRGQGRHRYSVIKLTGQVRPE